LQIQIGEPILTRDDRNAGVVDQVILDPDSASVTSVVLRKGMIVTHDVQVPVNQLREDASGHHSLTFDAAHLDQFPHFDPSLYTTPPPDLFIGEGYLPGSVLWPIGLGESPILVPPPTLAPDRALRDELVARLYEEDLTNAVVGAGSTILSRDERKVGELSRLTFAEKGGRLTSIVVRQGFLFPKEMELPSALVDKVDDGVIYLNVDKTEVEELARDEPESRSP